MNQNNENNMQEDEIDIRELFKTIVKYKVFIFVFTILVTVGAGIYALMKTPIYEVKSDIQVGYIGDALLGEPISINKELRVVFHVDDQSSNKKIKSLVTNISVNRQVKNFIEITTQGVSNNEALKKNKEVLTYAQNIYKKKIDNFIENTKNSIENRKKALQYVDEIEIPEVQREIEKLKTQKIVEVDNQIVFLQKNEISSLNEKIKSYQKRLTDYMYSVEKLQHYDLKDKSENMIVAIQMMNYQNLIQNAQNQIQNLKLKKDKIEMEAIPNLKVQKTNIQRDDIKKLEDKINITLRDKKIDLQKNIDDLEYLTSSANIKNTDIVGNYVIHDHPVKPRKKLIVGVAFVAGFVLSIFLVFFMEFVKGIKKEEEAEA
ncbi:Wzz/FepE/Etk N-terminal domain-containing protein [Sulfurimonas sp. HSL-1716]|uniref:Wzz/FepE/Etk N-terminal domain-containing protein n=1 Tax=Hydrocurvibacter sulfurireducens TaxID=3131937 RepID=UPI0031F93373